jgi:exopolysaccharide production protein ExoY
MNNSSSCWLTLLPMEISLMGRVCVHEQVSDQTESMAPVGGFTKRSLDIVLAAITLVLTAPILAMSVFALIVSGRREILSRQVKIGHRGCSFTSFELDISHRGRVERFLKLAGIHKLPQLFNVLRGEMSMIGPRPIDTTEIGRYGDGITFYIRARPGVIAVSELTHADASCAKAMKADADYIRHWRFSTDMALLFQVITTLIDRSPST